MANKIDEQQLKIYNPNQAASIMGINFETLRRIKQNKEIAYIEIPNKWGWGLTPKDINEYINSRRILTIEKEDNKK